MAEIDKMIKYSAETVGVYSKAKNRVKDFTSKVFGEKNKEKDDYLDIEILDASESVPADIKNVISKIKDSKLWDRETLGKVDPKMAKHINGLSKSINALVGKISNLKGENNVLNADFSDYQTAFVEYLKVVESYSSRLDDLVGIKNASVVKQREGLGISSSEREINSLISAFAYMGREVKVNPDGTYECGGTIDGKGFRYRDIDGNDQYIAISKEATQSFIDQYLKIGGVSTEKEKAELQEQQDALRQMKENQGEVGIYAPTSDDIKAQEKLVEKAQRALNEKMAQVVTPKGLFTYFVEQELIGDTSRHSTDKFSLLRARNEFSQNSSLWNSFEVERDPQLFLDDLSLMASSVLSVFKMQDISEKDVPAYGDDVKSRFASGIINSNRLDRLEGDLLRVKNISSDLATQNQQVFQDILEKYENLAGAVEESAKYEKDKTKANLMVAEAKARVVTLTSFGELVTELSDQIEAGQIPAPESVKNNIVGLVNTVVSNTTFENGKLSLAQDLTNEAGEVWLSKEAFDSLMTEQFEATEEATKETAEAEGNLGEKDTLEIDDENAMYNRSSAYGLKMDDGRTLGENIADYFGLYDAVALVQEGNNLVARVYDEYKKSGLTVDEFFNDLLGENSEEDLNQSLLGITNLDSIKTVCENYEHDPKDTEGAVNNFNKNEKVKSTHQKAQLAFYYMDCVINALKNDEKKYEEYLNADEETKDKIFAEKYQEIKKNIKAPDEKALKSAENKYKKVYQSDKIKGILLSLEGRDVPDGALDLISALAKQCGLATQNTKESGDEQTKDANAKKQAEKKKFGELYPRSPSAKAIAKKLQPFNIAAGIKFFNQLLDAFQKIDVKIGDDEDEKETTEKKSGNIQPKNVNNEKVNAENITQNLNAINNENVSAQNDAVEVKSDDTQAELKEDENITESQTVAQEQNSIGNFFEGRTDDQVRSRLAMMAVGMGINSILGDADKLHFNEDVNVGQIKQAMDFMTMQEDSQPLVDIRIDGSTRRVLLSDAMQYVFLNEFASGNKDAKEASNSIDTIASQLGNNQELVGVVKSMSTLMGAITPGEIIQMVRQTAEIQEPKPGEPMSIYMGSKLTPEDIAQIRNLKSMEQVRDVLMQSEVYNQEVINQIFEAGNELRNPSMGELKID